MPRWLRYRHRGTVGFGTLEAEAVTVYEGDMFAAPRRPVSLISHDMTLHPGDVICCGTSLGVGSMKEPRNTIEVTIDGIGTLSNVFHQ